MISESEVSFVIPAKNEELSIDPLLTELAKNYTKSEIIVVDDGSTDRTKAIAIAKNVIVVSHPYSKGNGAALKSGAKAASRKWVFFLDADGQHRIDMISLLLEKASSGYDMVVGARNKSGQASVWRYIANNVYNRFSSWIVKQNIEDLTSGFRLVKRNIFLKFLHLYPNGFSCPTTSTMAFFRSGYSVGYVSISVDQRKGNSHIRPIQDGLRFLLIIFKIGTLHSPLRLFLPTAIFQFVIGASYYLFTLITYGRFTNMAVMLILSSITTFLIGLISEQITGLLYKDADSE